MDSSTTKTGNIAAGAGPEVLAGVVVVIPCFNAGTRLRPVLEKTLGQTSQIVLVDDGSTDGCMEGIQDLPVRVVSLPINQGKGFALLAGFKTALDIDGTQAVCVIDADGQHDPDELPVLTAAMRAQQADLAIGSRSFDLPQVPWRSRFGNKLTATLTSLLLGRAIPDTQSGYRLHSRRLVEAVLREVPGGRYEMEMAILVKAVRERYSIISVPIDTLYEPGNPSSHFHKVRDSLKIYGRLLGAVVRRA